MGTVRREQQGAVARLVLDNPPRNVLTTAMLAELGRHVREVEDDSSVGAVIIQGAGPLLYTAGADIREMDVQAALVDRQATTRAWLEPIHRVLDAIAESSKVYLCAMKGISYGGGLEIAAACDIRLAAEDARFAMPEVKLGIIPSYGGTQRLPRLIGVGHALALVLSAREVTLETARVWGLVDLVTPVGEAEPSALAMAEQIAGYGPQALREAKFAIRYSAKDELERGLAHEREAFMRCSTSPDFDEGRRAFLEKRAPVFAIR